MKILQYFLPITITFVIIISFVASQSLEQTTATNSNVTTTVPLVHNKGKHFGNHIVENENKTLTDKRKKFKIRNQNKLYKLKKLLLETENKNSTNDKANNNFKKSNESGTDTASNLRNKTKNQLIVLQKELRRLTKIAEKLTELNEIYTVTKQTPTKKKPEGENRGKKNLNSKKGFNNKHKVYQSKNHNGDNDSGKKNNDQLSKNKGNDDRRQGKWKNGRRKIQTTMRPSFNGTTVFPLDKGHFVTSRIYTRQQKRRSTKKGDKNISYTTFSPKFVNTSFPPVTTVLPE
ncbi:Hypothetical protein SRAE_2000403200 [Strongyloides ratti]|uniref:Uncharacterized protein n=1 Tax=Strongyloides ratti TaxID=34506 RepID=A0A090LMH6_STRRB|nr:Hypothetical protein SRAE_2000403200 [Strongyloides ratti]CEF69383.1 Hypothetical protein SRAE_2000403200 [Strongyloides ratti]